VGARAAYAVTHERPLSELPPMLRGRAVSQCGHQGSKKDLRLFIYAQVVASRMSGKRLHARSLPRAPVRCIDQPSHTGNGGQAGAAARGAARSVHQPGARGVARATPVLRQPKRPSAKLGFASDLRRDFCFALRAEVGFFGNDDDRSEFCLHPVEAMAGLNPSAGFGRPGVCADVRSGARQGP